MAAVKNWLHRVETRTLVWLARGRTSSCVIVGTMVAASLGLASLSTQPSTAQQKEQVVTSPLPMSSYGCYNDPDGDGHILCDGSVAITKLPASYGQCQTDEDGDMQIICRGTGW
jgi:predicted lipoprotein with Yx(FWY)xxD motif